MGRWTAITSLQLRQHRGRLQTLKKSVKNKIVWLAQEQPTTASTDPTGSHDYKYGSIAGQPKNGSQPAATTANCVRVRSSARHREDVPLELYYNCSSTRVRGP